MKEIILQKCNFRCRENIYICRPLRRLRRPAVEYVKNSLICDHVLCYLCDQRAVYIISVLAAPVLDNVLCYLCDERAVCIIFVFISPGCSSA